MKSLSVGLFVCVLFLAQPIEAQRLEGHVFGVLPLFGQLTNTGNYTDSEVNDFLLELKSQIGESKGLFRVGFSGIMGSEAKLDQICRLSKPQNLSHIPIIGVQTHAITSRIKAIATADLRNFQWRKNGTTWNGVAGGEGRDVNVVTPSRYATELRTEYKAMVLPKALGISRVMNKYPGVILAVNVSIEEGLADNVVEDRMADYSPFAVTEFRDWLCHRGLYDADTGSYAGQGAPESIVGSFVSIHGVLRSPFYDDPSPKNANGTGVTFNAKFGTNFNTWILRYWDLQNFPGKLSDTTLDITPSAGEGFTASGFDAPRVRDTASTFWNAWSWDLADHGGAYPPGNPENPAFGFRQQMVRHFVLDVMNWIKEEGIPDSMITAHQIPGEFLSSQARTRSIASPIWTGLSSLNGTVGITRYGNLTTKNIQTITQYTQSWGIYEWHPQLSPTDNAILKTITKDNLTRIFAGNGQYVCPFQWNTTAGGLIPGGTSTAALYPVKNTGFSEGIREWLHEQPGYVEQTTQTMLRPSLPSHAVERGIGPVGRWNLNGQVLESK